jgi:hypothetical protein
MKDASSNTSGFQTALVIALAATVFFVPVTGANGPDLHRLWDSRCASCHGHSGDFSRKFLTVSNGELQGRHHTYDLRRFLHNHYLAGNNVDRVYDLLLAQVVSPPRFQQECSRCHETAAQFVREYLVLKDGMLCSRDSERPVSGFLAHHRNLSSQDVDFFMEVLQRVAHEVYGP